MRSANSDRNRRTGRARADWRSRTIRPGRSRSPTKYLDNLIATHRDDSAREIAQVYAWRNERDKAFEWLDRAYTQRDIGLAEMKGDPLFRNLEADPRWRRFMTEKMKLPT